MDATVPSGGRPALGRLAAFDLRQFGTVTDDLGIDLGAPVGPAAVTDLLAACLTDGHGVPPSRPELWSAPVGDRTAAMVAIAALEGDGTFAVVLRCPAPECGEDLEIEVTWDEVSAVAQRASDSFDVDAAGARYQVRRPTGADQERWLAAAVASRAPSGRDLLAELVQDRPPGRAFSDDELASIEAALDDHDPLVCFGLDVVCPACGAASRHEPSLLAMAAAVLRTHQRRLLRDVDALARAYGWSEAAILAIPAWRRAAYRDLIWAGA
ncbi:MAG: hypothetical protein A2V85_11575 [Chloroflexi bacterium RBG_16_72_14]|nr:MAG: hypothetical protein A2V85_11575 [Chloroflexi bacterium RBG_16_72_14]